MHLLVEASRDPPRDQDLRPPRRARRRRQRRQDRAGWPLQPPRPLRPAPGRLRQHLHVRARLAKVAKSYPAPRQRTTTAKQSPELLGDLLGRGGPLTRRRVGLRRPSRVARTCRCCRRRPGADEAAEALGAADPHDLAVVDGDDGCAAAGEDLDPAAGSSKPRPTSARLPCLRERLLSFLASASDRSSA